ncbi:MAG: DUF5819 family protein [Flavobacteriales bacterium]|nr:DUF5819 family protein [Flavobacteriales bacterium]
MQKLSLSQWLIRFPLFCNKKVLSGSKRIFVILLLALGLWHVFATIIYNIKPGKMPLVLSGLVSDYMTPFFHQNWMLFAPEPPTYDFFLFSRFKTKSGNWTEWRDFASEYRFEHYNNRFSNAGKFYTRHEHHARNLEKMVKVSVDTGVCDIKINDLSSRDLLVLKSINDYHQKFLFLEEMALDSFQYSVVEMKNANVMKRVLMFPKQKID